MPFGSPQNLFLYQQSGTSALNFMLHMSPLCVGSAILLIVFICVMYRKEHGRRIEINTEKITEQWEASRRKRRVSYLVLFVMILATIVSRTQFWYIAVVIVIAVVLIVNRKLFLSVDYVLLLTFFCFFVFSSSITGNEAISSFLHEKVAGNEYWWSIILSQFISNVPASIVLYPFTENFTGLIYGLDTAGLCSIIGSLASVINYRIYIREYPGHGKAFLRTFMWISWAFFLIVVVPGWLLTAWKFF